VFFGEYPVRFSFEKRRLALPAKIRQEIKGDEVVFARGFEKCILGYAREEWEKSARQQIEVPITEEKGRKIRRYLFSGAMVNNFDHQGRVVIPPMLVDYAQLNEEEVIIVGAGDHFEIWNKKQWQQYLKDLKKENL